MYLFPIIDRKMETVISSIDLGVIGVYFLIVMGLGFWVSRKTQTSEDLFLGGRSFTWGVVGISAIIFSVCSRMKAPPSPEVIQLYTYHPELIDQDNRHLPWFQNYKLWAGLLLGCILLIFVGLI